MKLLLTFVIALLGWNGYSQGHAPPFLCSHYEQLDELEIQKYRSGNESLRSDTVDVLNYSVYLDFTQGSSSILKGNCEVKFEAKMDINTISLDLLQLNIDSIIFQGNPATYSYNDTLIVVDLGGTINTGSQDSVTIYYNGSPQIDGSGWGGFYMSTQFFYNLGVGFDADPHNYGRVWHPCFDNFVERASYDFEILSADNKTAYCNGTRTNVQTVGTDSILTNWVMAEPIPTYLASVAVGDYTHVEQNYFSTSQSLNIPIWLAALEADTTNLKNSFVNLNGAMEAYETIYGPYEWERVGYVLVPFSSGAMEHATNVAYPAVTANGTVAFETLMAHELSHHWWGDWVTCETAEEMWINEGMAVYSEHTFLEHIYDYDTYLAANRTNHHEVLHRAHIDDSGYYALNAVPTKYTYGDHSYKKGADVMHTLRAYLGDANFFAGLQAVQNTYGGTTASSEQFRDAMNTVPGVDVTQFFQDWIFQSGFSQFSIGRFTPLQNGTLWDVDLNCDQKMKGASYFHTDVPFQVTFMDANWNTHTDNVVLGGDFQTVTVTGVPFEPVFAALNMDEKINHAVTADDFVITGTGIDVLTNSRVRVQVTDIVDSAFLRVEHNWVYADQPQNLGNVMASYDRYWNVHGVDLDNVTGKLKFDYNGENNANGDLDNSLMFTVVGQGFNEDSLVLLYRPDGLAEWQIHPDYIHSNAGNPIDRKGWMETQIFMPGQYSFGYRVHTLETIETPISGLEYSIYPNPADDSVSIDLEGWNDRPYQLKILAINGQLIETLSLNGGQITSFNTADIGSGTYLFLISDGVTTLGSKRVVIK